MHALHAHMDWTYNYTCVLVTCTNVYSAVYNESL